RDLIMTGVQTCALPIYLCSAAEKMSSPFLLRVHGRSGHASMPGISDNALVKAARLIERLAEYRPEPRLEPEVAGIMRLLVGRDRSEERRVGKGGRCEWG